MTREQPTQEAIRQEIRHRLEYYQRAFELLGYKAEIHEGHLVIETEFQKMGIAIPPKGVASILGEDLETIQKHRDGMLRCMINDVMESENGIRKLKMFMERENDRTKDRKDALSDLANDPIFQNDADEPGFEH